MANETILIVDDEEDILQLIRYNLEKEGYRTIITTSGEQALYEAKRNLPNLIILDLMLPGVD
ncbi:MAG: response regulator, partial [Sediminispirochaetaceae bacterium]